MSMEELPMCLRCGQPLSVGTLCAECIYDIYNFRELLLGDAARDLRGLDSPTDRHGREPHEKGYSK